MCETLWFGGDHIFEQYVICITHTKSHCTRTTLSSMSGKRESEDTLLVMMSARRSQKMPQKVTRLQCKLEDTIALS